MHAILTEDIRANPSCAYRSLLGFLELNDDGRDDFSARNEAVQGGSTVYRIAGLIPKPLKVALRKAGIGSSKLAAGVASKSALSREPLRPEFLAELRSFYRSDVELLSMLIERDLSAWLKD
jgi:hypothetical protein